MKNSNVVWDGHEGIKRIGPAVDLRGYWTFIAGFLFGVGLCVVIAMCVDRL